MSHQVYDTIKPANNQSFPIAESEDIKGGIHSIAYFNELDTAIPQSKKEMGMLCYVEETNKTYILEPKLEFNDNVYSENKDILVWNEFCLNSSLVYKGSLNEIYVPKDISTIIISASLKLNNTNNTIERIIPYSEGTTIRIINNNNSTIYVSNGIDKAYYAAKKDPTDSTKYVKVISYNYLDPNLIDESVEFDPLNPSFLKNREDYKNLDFNKYLIKLYDGKAKLTLSRYCSIDLNRISNYNWIDCNRSDIVEEDSNVIIYSDTKSPNIILKNKVNTIRLTNSNMTITNIFIDKPVSDYNGVSLKVTDFKEGDKIRIISSEINNKIGTLGTNDGSVNGSFASKDGGYYLPLAKNSITEFVYTLYGNKYLWEKVYTVNDNDRTVTYDETTLVEAKSYSVDLYENKDRIVITNHVPITGDSYQKIYNINYDADLSLYPEILLYNDVCSRGHLCLYTNIGNIDPSALGEEMKIGKDGNSCCIVPRKLYIKLKYNISIQKWQIIDKFYDSEDNNSVIYNVAAIMKDTTKYIGDIKSVNGVNLNGIESVNKNTDLNYWMKDTSNPNRKEGRQYYNWFKNVKIDGRTKEVIMDITTYDGVRYDLDSNVRKVEAGACIPSILEIYNISKNTNSEYDLLDGQEVTFSILESSTKLRFFSLHFVHGNSNFIRKNPTEAYRATFKYDNLTNKTIGNEYSNIESVLTPNIMLKPRNSIGTKSTIYMYNDTKEDGNTPYYNQKSNGTLDLPLEVPDLIIKSSLDYNFYDYISSESTTGAQKKLSTVTFKYNKKRNLWFEYKREIGEQDCRKTATLPAIKNAATNTFIKHSVFIDPETDSIISNSNIGLTSSNNTLPKNKVEITNISLGAFDNLLFDFHTGYNFINSNNTRYYYDKLYKNTKQTVNNMKEYIKNPFFGGFTDAQHLYISDMQEDAVWRMNMRMQLGCAGKKISILSLCETKIIPTQRHLSYELPDPYNLTENSAYEYKKMPGGIHCIDGTNKLTDPRKDLSNYTNNSTNKYTGPSDLYFHCILRDYVYTNAHGIFKLPLGTVLDMVLFDIWYPTSQERFITSNN